MSIMRFVSMKDTVSFLWMHLIDAGFRNSLQVPLFIFCNELIFEESAPVRYRQLALPTKRG